MERRGEGVIAGLGGIDLVIGMQGHAPLRRQVGDDLVDIHISLGTAAGLPNHQGKFRVPLPRPDLAAHGGDGVGLFLRQFAACGIGLGTGLLQIGKGSDNLPGLALAADSEILQAPLGLGAPVPVRRDGHGAHGVVFHAGVHASSLPFHL